MSNQNTPSPNNVIQFPFKKKEVESTNNANDKKVPAEPKPEGPKKKRVSNKNTLAALFAIALATGAMNRYVFGRSSVQSQDLASVSATHGRTIASVEKSKWNRDSAWEKSLAEHLASSKARDIASFQIGRPATAEEKLRWGTLEEKYTITFRPDVHEIDSILLQDASESPAYVLDREKFLSEYGHLFDGDYVSAKLTSVQKVADKTIEEYTLYDKEKRAHSEARFELDNYKRLISLKVQPTEI